MCWKCRNVLTYKAVLGATAIGRISAVRKAAFEEPPRAESDPKATLEMTVDFQLLMIGVASAWVGFAVLLFGKRPEKTFRELSEFQGRKLYNNLDMFFERSNIVIFKVLSYLGLVSVLVGVALMDFS